MKPRSILTLVLALALALATLVLPHNDASAQDDEPGSAACIPGSESGVLCDIATGAPTERMGCLATNTFEMDGSCFLYAIMKQDGTCFSGGVPDPSGLPRCIFEVPSDLQLGFFCDAPSERRGSICAETIVRAGETVACAEGVLVEDTCEIYSKIIVGESTCPDLETIVEVDGKCIDRIPVDGEGGCPGQYVLVAGDPDVCEIEVAEQLGELSCADPTARIDSTTAALCIAYAVPTGLPGLDCAGTGVELAACNDVTEHRQQGTFDGATLPGEQTTISFFDCEGAGSAAFRMRSGETTVAEGTATEGPAGVYSATYTAPPAGTYYVQLLISCPDESTNNVLYDLVQFPSCNGVAATIDLNENAAASATGGDDVIIGTDLPDSIDGLGGNDNICGEGGDDQLRGSAGDDIISGGAGRDFIRGNAGNDKLFGGDAIDRIWGNSGDDELVGQGGSDRLRAGGGDDTIRAGSGADRVWGGAGNDLMLGMGGQDRMWGEDGNDDMQGNFQSDQMWGGAGDDVLRGAGGKDLIRGEAGDDMMFGGNNTDFLDGGDGVDTADGQAGRDNPLVADVSGCIAETQISC